MGNKKKDIKSLRIYLRVFTQGDVDECYLIITENITTYMPWNPPKNIQDFNKISEWWIKSIEKGNCLIFTIRNVADDKLIGIISLNKACSKNPELGIFIGEKFQGYGFGKEALHTIMQWGKYVMNYNSFLYIVAIENIVSRKLVMSIGGVETSRKNEFITYVISKNNI